MREFAILLCGQSHHYATGLQLSSGLFCISAVDNDGYIIVPVQHFRTICACRATPLSSPIRRFLFIPSSSRANELEIVGEELCQPTRIFIYKAFLPCFLRFRN